MSKLSSKGTHLLILVLVGGFMAWPLVGRALKDAPSATPPTSSAAIPPELPRTYALPVPLFAPDSAWNQSAVQAGVLTESSNSRYGVRSNDFSRSGRATSD